MAMTTERLHPDDEAALDALFQDLRAETPVPSTAFLRRVLVDADQLAAHHMAGEAAPAPRRGTAATAATGWWARLMARPFAQATGGLAIASLLGFGLGFSGALTNAAWLGQVAPLLFATDSDTALTLLPEADSFVIALSEEGEVNP